MIYCFKKNVIQMQDIKILHLSFSDSNGGAGIAASRLHKYLLESDIDSHFICFKSEAKHSENMSQYGDWVKNTKRVFLNKVNKLLNIFDDKQSSIRSMNINSTNVAEYINKHNPDYLIMHWINGEACSIEDLKKIKKNIKIIWWCHDMWPFNGTYHNNFSVSDSHISKRIEDYFFLRKLNFVQEMNVNFICPSRWLSEIAKETYTNQKCDVVPNLIPKQLIKIYDKLDSREELGLDKYKKIISFAAIGGSQDPTKGGKYLNNIIRRLNRDDIKFIVIGGEKNLNDDAKNIEFVGHLDDFETINKYYCASNIFINTSIIENYPNTLVESILSGTPVVAFDVGGVSSIINENNGSLVRFEDIDSYISEIEYWLNKEVDSLKVSKSLKDKVQDEGFRDFLKSLT